MRSELLGGLSRWFFEADGKAAIGDYEFEATLYTANGVWSDVVIVKVAVPPEGPKKKEGSEPETGPDVQWVHEEDWLDHNGMDALTVGYVTEDEEETIIWLEPRLRGAEESARKPRPDARGDRNASDQIPVPDRVRALAPAPRLEEHHPRPDERYEKAEKQRLAEAVLVAIDPDVDVAMEESET